MRRGEIWWASLPPPVGSGPGYRRPVLVVQTDRFTESKIKTVVAAIMTTSVRWAEAPGNVRCAPRDTGLPRESVVNVSQIVTVDKTLFTERVGMVPTHVLSQVENGLRLVLGI